VTVTDANSCIEEASAGGTPPYSYQWSNGSTSSNITNVYTGYYTVIVTDANGCITQELVGVTNDCDSEPEPFCSIDISVSSTQESCDGNDGSISITVSDGTPPYTYEWSNGSTSQSLSNVSSGDYSVTVTDANACVQVASASVESKCDPCSNQAYLVEVSAYCKSTFGGISLEPYFGDEPYTYQWSNGSTSSLLNDVPPGNYSVTITDANGCATDISASINCETCMYASMLIYNCGEELSADAQSMAPPYTYLWSNGRCKTEIFINQDYCNESSCKLNISTTSETPESCAGNDGSILLTVTDGTSPYTYKWSNGSISQNLNNLPAGVYSVLVTDASGCSAEASAVVENNCEPPFCTLTVSTFTIEESCTGNDGKIELTIYSGTSPYTYLWSNDSTSQNLDSLSAGEYSVIVTDADGCGAEASVIVDKVECEECPFSNCIDATNMVICPGKEEINICAPIGIPPAKSLADFTLTGYDSLSITPTLQIDQQTEFHDYYSTTTYTYKIADSLDNEQICVQSYHIANQFLRAPEVTNPSVVCQDELWSYLKLGSDDYKIYGNDNGEPGEELKICNTPGLHCSTASLAVNTVTPATYQFWVSQFFSFPNGDVCESATTPFTVEIYPKPVVSLSTSSITISKRQGIALMDMVTDNISGYWSGKNIINIYSTDGENIPYFSTNQAGTYKLYYTVKNDYCKDSYLLIVNVSNEAKIDNTITGQIQNTHQFDDNLAFEVFPIPAGDQVHIKLPNVGNVASEMQLLDLNGKILLLSEFEGPQFSFDVSNLAKGVYLLEIQNKRGKNVQKIVVK